MCDSNFGFVDDYEWKVCWDFKKDIGWSPDTDTVFPPSPWKSKSGSSGAWKGDSKGKNDGRQGYGKAGSAANVTGGCVFWAPPGYPPGPPHGHPSDAPPFGMFAGDTLHPPSSAFSPTETPASPWWFAPPPPPPPPQPQCGNDGSFGGSFGSMTAAPRRQGDVKMGNDERGCAVEEEWWAPNKSWNVEEENDERAGNARSGKSHNSGAGIGHGTTTSVSRAAPRDKKASNSRGRGSGCSGDADVDRENAGNVPVPGGARGGRSARWQLKSANDADVKARGGVAAAIDALLEQVGPTLQKTDFDNRVRRTLSAILASGGLGQVQDALELVRSAVAHKPRDSVRNWPGYLVTLVKTFEAGAKQSAPQAVAGGKGAASNESAKASNDTPPEQTAEAVAARVLRESRSARPDPALSSTSWAAVDQEERGVAVAAVPAPSQNSEVATSKTAATSQSPPLGSLEHAEEEVDDWPVRKAIRQGNLLEALDLVSKLPMVTARVAERVLSALGRTPALGEDVMDKLMDLAGRFSATAFDGAAAEAHQRGDALACYQLYQVAGLLCVPKTVETLTHLLLGQVSDPVRARSIVEELLSEDSDVTLTHGFAEALVAVCAAADDTDLAAAVFEKATAHGITVDMPASARKS